MLRFYAVMRVILGSKLFLVLYSWYHFSCFFWEVPFQLSPKNFRLLKCITNCFPVWSFIGVVLFLFLKFYSLINCNKLLEVHLLHLTSYLCCLNGHYCRNICDLILYFTIGGVSGKVGLHRGWQEYI